MASIILDILITPVTELAKLLVGPLQRQVGYLVKYRNKLNQLESAKEKLRQKRKTAERATDEARRRGEAVNTDMEQWLDKANKTLSDMQRILAYNSEAGADSSCQTCCIRLSRRYGLSKKAVKLQKIVDELHDSMAQIPVSRPALPPNIEVMPTGDFEAFDSTKEAIKNVIGALNDTKNNIIGLYGMGGVGKTCLIREVAKHAKITNMFDEVVIATVSRNPDLKKIQREIAEGLGLRLVEETEHVRSLRLAERLNHKRQILIILDDVWERLELSQVGIPSGKNIGNCTIAIVTRNLDVCSQMHSNVTIRVDVLSEKDSWDLFKKVAGDIVESPDLNPVAKEVSRECGGLPIALVTVARTLRNKDPQVWEDAACELRGSRPVNIKGMHENVFSCLKLSFDDTQNEESRLCYLYCCLFPEDYDVQVEDLLRYAIGEGLFSDLETIDEARNRIYSICSNLKASCLLLSSNRQGCVKMHDVFRDLSLFIATSNDYSFMVKASSGLEEWPTRLRLEYVMRMSLIDNKFQKFSGQSEYPELLLLLLQNNITLSEISDDFFGGMRALQVLDLSNMPYLQKLPSSLSCLKNLRTLIVENSNIRNRDGSALGELISLEILSLRKSTFSRFPEEIRRLTNLRLLELTEFQAGVFPAKVLPSLRHLEELYMEGSYNNWAVNESEDKNGATLEEVFSMASLNTLHIDIRHFKCLAEEITSCSSRLKKFRISVGERCQWQSKTKRSLCFNISDNTRVLYPEWLKRLLQRKLELRILSWKNLKSLEQLLSHDFQPVQHLDMQQCDIQACFSGAIIQRIKDLQVLQISSCSSMETVFLFDESVPRSNLLPRLTRLHIQDSPKLINLWKGRAPSLSFQSLQSVKIEWCVHLKALFPLAIAQSLNQLQYLEIAHCERMEAAISHGSDEIQADMASSQPDEISTVANLGTSDTLTLFPQLHTLKLMYLQNFTSLTTPLFVMDFPSLQHLTMLSMPHFKRVPFGSKSLQNLVKVNAERTWLEEVEFEDKETKWLLLDCLQMQGQAAKHV